MKKSPTNWRVPERRHKKRSKFRDPWLALSMQPFSIVTCVRTRLSAAEILVVVFLMTGAPLVAAEAIHNFKRCLERK